MMTAKGRVLLIASSLVLLLFVLSFQKLCELRDMEMTTAAGKGSIGLMCVLILLGANFSHGAPRCGVPLVQAASQGQLETVQFLLENGAEVNAFEKFGYSALIAATCEGHSEVVRCLLNNDAAVNQESDEGTALDIAQGKNFSDIASMIQAAGGKSTAELRGLPTNPPVVTSETPSGVLFALPTKEEKSWQTK